MSILKTILLIIVSVIALVLIVALFVKKEFSSEREITINKPKQQVFDYIKYLKNQNDYSKWATMDPNMKKQFTGTDGTPGFISAWDSPQKDVGKGEQEIKKVTEGERVDYEIRFIKPFPSTSVAYMTTEAVGQNQTKVKWGFSGKMSYPMNAMQLFMNMEKTIGDDLQTGLNNLKGIMEKQ